MSKNVKTPLNYINIISWFGWIFNLRNYPIYPITVFYNDEKFYIKWSRFFIRTGGTNEHPKWNVGQDTIRALSSNSIAVIKPGQLCWLTLKFFSMSYGLLMLFPPNIPLVINYSKSRYNIVSYNNNRPQWFISPEYSLWMANKKAHNHAW